MPVVVAFAVIAIGAGMFLGLAGWPQPHRTLEFSGLILAAILTSALAMQQSPTKDWATMPLSFVIDFTALLLLGPQAAMLVAAAGAVTGDVESYCRVGRDEIAKGSLVGSLLRSSE